MEKKKTKNYFFYVLLCADGTLYGGYTTDLQHRLTAHNTGRGAKYTRVKKRQPVKILYYETFKEKRLALQAEYAFKHQSRAQKLIYLRAAGVTAKLPQHLK
ncbi:GIY-YIG nuclease family protein [Liquorilactobacillus capillatus]|uniref:GIY-YIG domain-containing protein n=1 Tax=Liquorilactobacillus capillatus DSM 19910 TaxID=1423731 RepID=A0A0R1MAR0_9LACO|nr:GIY-YIG nuclease family protein [Liquorilactobacillus capillatus]KRL01307.1 hypothetical protein FC81_GL001449 [Liquorilactobacillus capillatus DSM 19910]